MSAAKEERCENPEAEWFGYEHVSSAEKTKRVIDVFSSVASKYDLMNDLMSGGLHRLWKDHFVAKARVRAGEEILDVAGGTGDIAIRCVRRTQGKAHITVCDLNESMLEEGRKKALDNGLLSEIDWVHGNAEKLPFDDASMDLVTISFGLRNVTHIDKALAEFARVLKPGGRFTCMEFSPGVCEPVKKLYDLYSFTVLPWLGAHVAGDEASYQYLAESIRQFPDQEELAGRMETAGFSKVTYENLIGGIAVIHTGWKNKIKR